MTEENASQRFPAETRERLIALAEKSSTPNNRVLLGPSRKLSEIKRNRLRNSPRDHYSSHDSGHSILGVLKSLSKGKNLNTPPPPGTVGSRYSNIFEEGESCCAEPKMNRSADFLASGYVRGGEQLRNYLRGETGLAKDHSMAYLPAEDPLTPPNMRRLLRSPTEPVVGQRTKVTPERPLPLKSKMGDIRLEDLQRLYSSLPDPSLPQPSEQDSDGQTQFYLSHNPASGIEDPAMKGVQQILNHGTACSSPTDSGYRSVPRLGVGPGETPKGPMVTSAGIRIVPSEPPQVPAKPAQVRPLVRNGPLVISMKPDAVPPPPAHTSPPVRYRAGSVDETLESVSSAYSDELSSYPNSSHSSLDRIPKGAHSNSNELWTRLPRLEPDRLPWTEKDIVNALQQGRTHDVVNRVSVEVVPQLLLLLQWPLLRIAREAQRLAARFRKLTRHDLHFAVKMVLPGSICESCLRAGLQAGAMFAMSGESARQSKSRRAGIRLPVGSMLRWLLEFKVSSCVHEQAAVFLAAVMECLLEEMVLQSLGDSEMLSPEELQLALGQNPLFSPILQPHAHLSSSRNGFPAVPNSSAMARPASRQRKERVKTNGSIMKNLEQSLLATSFPALADLVEVLQRLELEGQQSIEQHNTSTVSSNTTSSSSSSNPCLSSIGVPTGRRVTPWSRDALATLHYYMQAHDGQPLALQRGWWLAPPLVEWLRVSLAHCEHRSGACVDQHDVTQSARLLLPGLDCPPRSLSELPEDYLVASGRQSPSPSTPAFRNPLGFKLLAVGRSDLIPHAHALLGPPRLDALNEMGLSPLMLASARGEAEAVRLLLDSGADPLLPLPAPSPSYPTAPPDFTGWTALTFAVAAGHPRLLKLLLERSPQPGPGVPPPTETPLQMAAMVGCPEMVNMLLAHGHDPFQCTYSDELRQRGSAAAVCLAASHGHRRVLQLMLQRRRARNEEMLSLEDFLAEGAATSQRSPAEKPHFSKSQLRTLHEAMYHAAESGHVDIVIDLKNLGLSMTMHVWSRALSLAQELRRKALLQLLLAEAPLEDIGEDFPEHGLPLLFDIFAHAKNEVVASQVAEILSQLYGEDEISPIPKRPSANTPRIDGRFVNNSELSDVQFSVEGRLFYGHKILLLSASPRFARLLRDAPNDQPLHLENVSYSVFQLMMEFLYKGNIIDSSLDLSTLLQVLSAAHEFELEELVRVCEQDISKRLTLTNCPAVYSHAMEASAEELLQFCEGFFLQNLPQLLASLDSGFRTLLYRPGDLTGALQSTLAKRLKTRRVSAL